MSVSVWARFADGDIRKIESRFAPAERAELNTAVAATEVQGARLPDSVLVYTEVEAAVR